MKPIEKDELYTHLGHFLRGKGIELKAGSYANGIQKSCGLLTDVINLSQQGVQRAKSGVEKKLDQMRQVIHEKTAPRKPGSAASRQAPAAKAAAKAAKAKARSAKSTKPKS